MALDFPSNPTDGQIYGAYSYSLDKGVWQSREESSAVTITSPVAPSIATPGDLWFNSTTGLLFTYYSDGTSSQWVEVLSSAVPNAVEIMPAGTVTQTARSTAPVGWLLCEGQTVSRITYDRLFDAIGTSYGTGDGTTTFTLPNLKGRVPVGRDSSQTEFDSLGESGGVKTVTLAETQIPSHAHSGTTALDGAHTHTYSGTTGGESGHSHGITGISGLGGAGAGQLALQNDGNLVWYRGNGTTWASGQGGGGSIPAMTVGGNQSTSTGGSSGHTHGFSGTTSGVSNNHNHTFTTGNTGGGLAHENLQPYVVLNYMIKV